MIGNIEKAGEKWFFWRTESGDNIILIFGNIYEERELGTTSKNVHRSCTSLSRWPIGQLSLDHGRAGDAISEGIYMRISPTFVILFGSPGYHWNHNEETFTEFQPWLIVNVCVFNEKTSLAFITKAWVGRNKRSNLYLMEVQKYYVSFSSAQFCVQMTELSKSWLQATATAT